MIDINKTKDSEEAARLIKNYSNLQQNNNYEVISIFDLLNESRSFISKEFMREHVSNIMQYF